MQKHDFNRNSTALSLSHLSAIRSMSLLVNSIPVGECFSMLGVISTSARNSKDTRQTFRCSRHAKIWVLGKPQSVDRDWVSGLRPRIYGYTQTNEINEGMLVYLNA